MKSLPLATVLLLLSTRAPAALVGGTFIGAAEVNDVAEWVAVGPAGDVYVAGELRGQLDLTGVPGYDLTYHSDPAQHADDVYVARYDAAFTTLKGFTYLGGESLDWAKGLRIDADGNLFVLVHTGSSQLNVTPSGYDGRRDASGGGLLVKLDPTLQQVLAATFVESDAGNYTTMTSLCLDAAGNPLVVGYSQAGFPTTSGAYQRDYAANADYPYYEDGFVAKYDPSLDSLLAATYLGGTRNDTINACAMSPGGDVVLVGTTNSPTFPVTSGAWDTTLTALAEDYYHDGFVARLSGDLSTLVAATYLTAESQDALNDVAVDGDGNVFVAGSSKADPFPEGAVGDEVNGFLVRFDPTLSALTANRTFPYTAGEYGYRVLIDGEGRVIYGGASFSYGGLSFPISDGAAISDNPSHAVAAVMRLDNDLTGYDFATVAGGYFGADTLRGMALGGDGTLYFTGFAQTVNFPVPDGGYQSSCAGGSSGMACYDGYALALTFDATLQPPQLALAVTGQRVEASWNAISGVVGYRLHYAPNPYMGPETIQSLDLGDTTSLAVDLPRGASFYVAVEAYDGSGNASGYSNIELFTIP
ncbi:SBBP repeat-containing protein [Endothiovibrio diazotrophicus]